MQRHKGAAVEALQGNNYTGVEMLSQKRRRRKSRKASLTVQKSLAFTQCCILFSTSHFTYKTGRFVNAITAVIKPQRLGAHDLVCIAAFRAFAVLCSL